MSALQLIPDFILAPSFIYVLVRIGLSKDSYFHSTFFKLFISAGSFILENCNTIQKSGIGSLASTISFGILTLFSIPLPVLWIFMIVLVRKMENTVKLEISRCLTPRALLDLRLSNFTCAYIVISSYAMYLWMNRFVSRKKFIQRMLQVWSNKFVNYLIALTYIILLLNNIPVLCFGFNTR